MPEQVVDFQTLVGDSVDNVPGVPGIGVKTAAKLLQQFGTLDALMARLDELPKGKMKENLQKSGELVQLSRKLVRLDDQEIWSVPNYHQDVADDKKTGPYVEQAVGRYMPAAAKP